VLAEDGANRVSLVFETLDEVEAKPERWLDRDFIKIEKPNSIALTSANPSMNWKLTRTGESADWKLADAKPDELLDSAKTAQIPSTLANLSFADVLPPDAKPDSTGLDKPSTVTAGTSDDFVYVLKIGKLIGDNYAVGISVNATPPKERTPAK